MLIWLSLSILHQAQIAPVVDLPSVGTNYHEGASVAMLYNLSATVNKSAVETLNEPGTGASNLLNITQLLGDAAGKAAAQDLQNTVKERAAAIVASGAFTNEKGMETMLAYQAQSIADFNGGLYEIGNEIVTDHII